MLISQIIHPDCPAPIGWLGGKTRLRPTIINCMPKHSTYVEVFAGSATVFFGKPPVKNEIINDINEELINLYHVLSGTYFDEKIFDEFVEYVRWMPAARAAFETWKHWEWDKLKDLNPAQRAFVYYYCIKKGFSSVKQGGYEASSLSKSRYNQNTDFERFRTRFSKSNAQIERMDFRNLIKKYAEPRADVFFFCDPPYFVADGTNYYEHVFNSQDHQDFKACCDHIDQSDNKFLITYDDVPEVLDLYKEYHIYRTDPIIYSASEEAVERKTAKTELFITNYDLVKMFMKRRNKGMIFEEESTDSDIALKGCIGLHEVKS